MENFREKFFNSLFSNMIFVGAFTLLINITNYLFNVYLAIELPEDQFAIFTGIIAIMYLVMIPFGTFEQAVTKTIAENPDANKTQFFIKYNKIFIKISILTTFIYFLISPLTARLSDIPIKFILLMGLTMIPVVVLPYLRGLLMGVQRIKLNYILSLLDGVLRFTVLFIFINIVNNVVSSILAWVISGFLAVVFTFYAARYAIRNIKNSNDAIEITSFEYKDYLPILVGITLFNAGITLDLVLVDNSIRAEYGAISLIGKIVYFGCVTFTPLLFAIIAKERSVRIKTNYFLMGMGLISLIGGALIALFYFYSEFIVNTVFSGKYDQVAQYLPLFAVGVVMYAATFMILSFMILINRYRFAYFMIVMPIIQAVLFSINSTDLKVVVQNQLITFSVCFLLSIISLIYLSFSLKSVD